LSSKALFRTTKSLSFIFSHSRLFKQFDLLLNNLSENHFNGSKIICFVRTMPRQSVSRYFETLDEANSENVRKQYHTIVMPLYQGFIDEENQITCYTDHQILNATISLIKKWLFKSKILL
jgi:transcription-repair coupling factor (superfamily II helicase)